MSDKNPTLQDVWKLMGCMHRRIEGFDDRFDVLERQMVAMNARIGALDASVSMRIGALKESIEARDFRFDEHGRRLTKREDFIP